MENNEKVTLSCEDGVATLIFENTHLNILSMPMRAQIDTYIDQLLEEGKTRVLIIHGAGGKAFSVGSDIKEFDPRPGYGIERNTEEHRVFNKIRDFPFPTIAAIEGYALGGGLELALTCDLRVASENSMLGVPEITLGVFPGGGGCDHLTRLLGLSKAKELMYTGDPITAQEAWRIGLVNRLAPKGEALKAAQELGKHIASRSGLSLQVIKEVADKGIEMPLKEAFKLEIEGSERLFNGKDVHEGVRAFKEKRPPVFNQ
ncbi:MAG: enoyl-CoA hydratase/isomerase family protein [Clostridia bacterium]|nr:enoyl-CoA hydratase/isomerase family protein [Clostridia bacterium]